MSDSRETWELLVGRLVLNCGDIELRLLQLYWNLRLQGNYDPKVLEKGMGDKAKMLLRIVSETESLPLKLKNELRRSLNRTIKLAHTRNLVAHNPLYLDIYSGADGSFVLAPHIRSLRNTDKHVSLDGLNDAIAEAKQLQEDLWGAVVKVAEVACPPVSTDEAACT